MPPELKFLSFLMLTVTAFAAEPAPASKVTPAEWLRQQPAPRFKPGHTLPRLGQMHCINPPADFRTELACNWGFAVRLSRPKGEPELLRLCAENPAVYQPAAMIGNLANLEGSKSIPWPEGTFLRKADGSLVNGRQIFSPEMPDAAWRMIIDEALRQIEGQLGGLPAASLATIENWTEYGLTVPIEMAIYIQGGGVQPGGLTLSIYDPVRKQLRPCNASGGRNRRNYLWNDLNDDGLATDDEVEWLNRNQFGGYVNADDFLLVTTVHATAKALGWRQPDPGYRRGAVPRDHVWPPPAPRHLRGSAAPGWGAI